MKFSKDNETFDLRELVKTDVIKNQHKFSENKPNDLISYFDRFIRQVVNLE